MNRGKKPYLEKKAKGWLTGRRAISHYRVVSEPGAKVRETVYELTRKADEQMRISVDLPQALVRQD